MINLKLKTKKMRLGYLMSVAIIPTIIVFSAINNQEHGKNKHGKDKGNSENYNDNRDERGNNGNRDERDYNDNGNRYYQKGQHDNGKNHGNDKMEKYYKKDRKEIEKSYKEQAKFEKKRYKENEKWDDGKWDNERFNNRMSELKGRKKHDEINQRYYSGVDWFPNQKYYEVKNPRNFKKVTICHTPNGSEYPVTINVSENALKAHLNHGDYLGECKDWDRSRYSDSYWNTRTDYYNQYVQTTETLSLGQQLLALAINKLTNSQQQLTAQRPSLTSRQISDRELAIINLQNDTYNLRNSLDNGNNRVVNVNFGF
jgi:hypothetical protein